MVYTCMQPTVTDSNLKGGRANGPWPPNLIWLEDPRPDSLIGKKVNNSREEGRREGVTRRDGGGKNGTENEGKKSVRDMVELSATRRERTNGRELQKKKISKGGSVGGRYEGKW